MDIKIIHEYGWLILAFTAGIAALITDIFNWIILAVLCFCVSLQYNLMRKKE